MKKRKSQKRSPNKFSFFCWGFVIFIFLVSSLILVESIFLPPQSLFTNFSLEVKARYPRMLDGELVHKTKIALKPIGVVVENHFESLPVSGLEQASIIYETIVEGEITRFLAIFDYDFKAEKIGPVRSVRLFFVDLAQEWNPVFFHSGGSKEALKQLKTSSMYNIDEISANGIYFWRDLKREQPHNLYTSSELIKEAIKNKKINQEADFSPWLFKDDLVFYQRPENSSDIVIDFSTDLYQVIYKYNRQENNYYRYLAGKPHLTADNQWLKAKNIVIQYVKSEIIDDYGRLNIDLESGGKAEIYLDGLNFEGQWQKENGRTRFYNQEGEEIKFNPGTIWVELVFKKS